MDVDFHIDMSKLDNYHLLFEHNALMQLKK